MIILIFLPETGFGGGLGGGIGLLLPLCGEPSLGHLVAPTISTCVSTFKSSFSPLLSFVFSDSSTLLFISDMMVNMTLL